MKINLRKANALAKALQAEAHKQSLPTSVSISIYRADTVDAVVEATGKTLRANLEAASELLGASYDLRRLLGAAFQSSGIDDLLTEKASLDAQEKLISKVVDRDHGWTVATPRDLATPRLTALKQAHEAPTGRGYGADALDVRLDEDAFAGLEDKLREIRRRKSQIADELLNLNTTHTLDVPSHVQALVDTYKLN